jgi:hypothetical protein
MDVHVRPKVSPANEASLTLITFEWFIICLKMYDFKWQNFPLFLRNIYQLMGNTYVDFLVLY